MIQRVAVFGTESTGKTTLARALAERFGAPWAREYVRDFWDQRGGVIRSADLGAIARGQIANEETAAARAQQLVICDTELITNTLWADLLFPGECPGWVRDAAARRSRAYALYLLCDSDIDFVDDVQRCFPAPAEREQCRDLWRAELTRRGLAFVDIRGPLSERIVAASTAISQTTGLHPVGRSGFSGHLDDQY